MSQATFSLRGRNPDVLTCIANLSNDEVFTPPEFANQMLDTLETEWARANGGSSIWADPSVTFLDPFTKSGVFLREITSRLSQGLASSIPDLRERVDHILTKQVYGIAITELTGMLARRSLYCSKTANGKHSIATSFATGDGNIWFERTDHVWEARKRDRQVHPATGDEVITEIQGTGRCRFCGANESSYARGDELETYAYAFIHTDDIKAQIARQFGAGMHFDVIVGNPPYQLSDGGAGMSAKPIYHHFVKQAQALEPRFITMVTPSRWMAGGKGLDEYRAETLRNRHIRVLVDFINASEAFPGVDVAGGISYFLWDRDNEGDCLVTTIQGGKRTGPVLRRLDEFDVFVRHAQSVSVLHRVWPDGPLHGESMAARVAPRMAFGFASNDRGKSNQESLDDPIELISSASNDKHREWINRSSVTSNSDWIDEWKSTCGGAAPAGGRPDKNGQYYGLSSIRVLPPGTVCTESYLVAGHFKTEAEARNLDGYLRTRFVRFLISLRAVTQHVTRGSFAFVPVQDFSRSWTDSDLYEKYELSDHEVAFIEQMVRPMEGSDE